MNRRDFMRAIAALSIAPASDSGMVPFTFSTERKMTILVEGKTWYYIGQGCYMTLVNDGWTDNV